MLTARAIEVGSPAPEDTEADPGPSALRSEDRWIAPAWMADAACKGRTSLFFGAAGERPERRARREAAARKLCAGCTVAGPCRDLARTGRENGFWGGESEEERAAAGHPPRSISRRSVQEAAAC